MYVRESWTVKKAECWRIDAFELLCWRQLLRVPCTARRSNQLILKEINAEYSLEVLMLKLKLQYFCHLMWRTDSLEKILRLGEIEGGEGDNSRWDCWMASPAPWTWAWASSRSWWWTGNPGTAVHWVLKSLTQLNTWTELRICWVLGSKVAMYYKLSIYLLANVYIGMLLRFKQY